MSARILSVAAVALCACGWKSDGLTRLEELYPTPAPVTTDAGAVGPIDIGTPRCSGFAGTWAVRFVQNGTIAPLGEAWKMKITDMFLADGTGQEFDLRFCDQAVAITTSGGATDLGRSKAPDALKTVLAHNPIRIPVPTNGMFGASNIVWLWGLKDLTDPLTDVLPTKDNFATDPRVFDQDQDTHPGVTLQILAPLGDRYMVRRAVWTFAPGKLTFDNAWITGALSSTIVESGLGATNALLLTPAPITPKPDGTVYQLRCVGETYTCASLAKDVDELFKDAP